MKRLPLVLPLLPAVLFATGCHFDHVTHDDDWCDHGCDSHHDTGITRSYDEVDFDQIEVHSAFHLTVRQSDTFRVSVTVPEGSVDNIQVTRSGSRLRLSMEHGFLDGEVSAVVELPVLRQIAGHDASEVRLDRIRTPDTVTIGLEDASQVDGQLDAGKTVVDLGSTSRATLDGKTAELTLHASGFSEADLRNLPCRRADVRLSDASTATIDVSERLDVTASTLSVLHYYGDPHLGRVDLSSGGHIEHEH